MQAALRHKVMHSGTAADDVRDLLQGAMATAGHVRSSAASDKCCQSTTIKSGL